MAIIYSLDFRQRAVYLHQQKSMSVKKIAKLLGASRESIYIWLRMKKTTGSIEPKTGYQKGHSHKITDIAAFKKLVDANPHDSALKLAQKIGNISKATVAKTLKLIGYSKKKTFGYKERNEEDREKFKIEIATKNQAMIIYLDESGIDDNEVYEKAWGPIGPRIYGKKSGGKKMRYSLIGALRNDKFIAPFIFEGSCSREVFEIYLKKVLLPELVPGSVIVMDNASFHKGGKIAELVQDAKCTILYLPAYSPDLNSIEKWWFKIKNLVRYLVSTTIKKFKNCINLVLARLCNA